MNENTVKKIQNSLFLLEKSGVILVIRLCYNQANM